MAPIAKPHRPETGSSSTNYGRPLEREKLIIGLGVLAGLLLAIYVLPHAGPGRTYRGTVRIDVRPLTSSLLAPAARTTSTAPAGKAGSGEPPSPFRDVAIAGTALGRIGPAAAHLSALAHHPQQQWAAALAQAVESRTVPGSTNVDFSFVDKSPAAAQLVIGQYAVAYVNARNAADADLTAKGLKTLQDQADRLNQSIAALARQADIETDPLTHTMPSTATTTQLRLVSDRWRTQIGLIDNVRRQMAFLGPRTAVEGPLVVAAASKPISQGVLVTVGLLLGLIAGIGMAFVKDAVRPKVLVPEDVERATQAEVIDAVPLPRISRPSQIAVAARPYGGTAEAFRRVAAGLERRGLGRDITALAVTSAGRFEGKSTAVANLATALADKNTRVAVISGDMRRPEVERFFGLKPGLQPGLAEFLQGDVGDPMNLMVAPVVTGGASHAMDSILVLPAGEPTSNPAELLMSDSFKSLVQSLCRDGFIVLIDAPPAGNLADAVSIAGAADAVMLVTRARVSQWRSLSAVARVFNRAGLRFVGTVLLGATTRSTSTVPWRRGYVGSLVDRLLFRPAKEARIERTGNMPPSGQRVPHAPDGEPLVGQVRGGVRSG